MNRPVQPSPRPAAQVSVVPLGPSGEVRLIPIPRLAAGGRWRVEAMRSISEPLLLWITRGQGRITVAGVTRGYGAHNAIFIPPGTMHGFEVSQHVFGTALYFGKVSGLGLPDQPVHLRIRDAAPQAELTTLLDQIQREKEAARAAWQRAVRQYLGLLGVWMERQMSQQEAPLAKPDAASRLAARYAALLERDFRSGMGVADYAAALGVTPTHLTRVCRQRSGRSAHDILQERVLFEARRLLIETKLPVKSVSETLGFTSAAYFTRAFQTQVGKTPTEFRKAP